jgi:hypothetical protein
MNNVQIFLFLLGICLLILPLPSFFRQASQRRSLFIEGRTALGISMGCLLIALATSNELYEKSGSLICMVGLVITIVFVAVARAHTQNVIWKWLWKGKTPIERFNETRGNSKSSENDIPKNRS